MRIFQIILIVMHFISFLSFHEIMIQLTSSDTVIYYNAEVQELMIRVHDHVWGFNQLFETSKQTSEYKYLKTELVIKIDPTTV